MLTNGHGERKETGGSKRFEYTEEDLERIRNTDTESTREFKTAYKKWLEGRNTTGEELVRIYRTNQQNTKGNKRSSRAHKHKKSSISPSKKQSSVDVIGILIGAVVFLIIYGFAYSAYVNIIEPDRIYLAGSPATHYFYDISLSCSAHESKIETALQDLTAKTSVRFIRVPYPVAIIGGGISYSCNTQLSNVGAAGEAERGYVGAGFIFLVWNHIKLSSVNNGVILHETLHSMGFDHTTDATSIMHPYGGSNILDGKTTNFVKTQYVNNVFAYPNILPINTLYVLFFLLIFISHLFGKD